MTGKENKVRVEKFSCLTGLSGQEEEDFGEREIAPGAPFGPKGSGTGLRV
jgi:hypothetical protein